MKRVWVIPLLVIAIIMVPQISATESPSPRMGSRMIYDPVDHRVILFGGAMYEDGYTLYNDLWSYRYESNTLTEIETTGCPSGRFNTPMYIKAEDLAMDFMEHVVIKEGLNEVRYVQIIKYLKEKRVHSADLRFFGELATKTLKEHDVVVWRTK